MLKEQVKLNEDRGASATEKKEADCYLGARSQRNKTASFCKSRGTRLGLHIFFSLSLVALRQEENLFSLSLVAMKYLRCYSCDEKVAKVFTRLLR